MDSLLEEYLYTKYPDFFKDKDSDMSQTCMCWGLCCEDGWFGLINLCCDRIAEVLKAHQLSLDTFNFTQIKEKYGGLRLYFSLNNPNEENGLLPEGLWDTIQLHISEAENASYKTCEFCGEQKTAKERGECWITVRCDFCQGLKR